MRTRSSKPEHGGSQIIVAGFEQVRRNLRVLRDRRQKETLFRQAAIVPYTEDRHIEATRRLTPNFDHHVDGPATQRRDHWEPGKSLPAVKLNR